MLRRYPIACRCCLALVCAAVLGCGGGSRPVTAETNLQTLAMACAKFKMVKGKLPADAQELKAFIISKDGLFDMDEAKAEQMLTSPRDGQPFVWNLPKGPAAKRPLPKNHILACEKEGVGDKRFALYAIGKIEEVDSRKVASRAARK